MKTPANHHPPVESEADALLARAYALNDDAEAHMLYSEWAATYDRTMLDGLGYLTPARTASILATRLGNRNATILDVGAGTGLAGENLASQGSYTIDALDYSAAMLEIARHRDVYRSLIKADLNGPLTLPDESYNALICTGTFTHAHVGATCLDELFRILKPGGLFACTVHRDIWEPQGFAQTTGEMAQAGRLETLHFKEGTYYQNSAEPEGWYILWRKPAVE
jgi:predicted TPR repeat methyltransferase